MLASIFSYGFILATVVLLLNGGRISFAGGISLAIVYTVYCTGLGDTLLSLTSDNNFNVVLTSVLTLGLYSIPLTQATPKNTKTIRDCSTLVAFVIFFITEYIVMVGHPVLNSFWVWDAVANTVALVLIIIPNTKGTYDVISNFILRYTTVHPLRSNGS